MGLTDELVKSLYLNTNSIANAILLNISDESVNGLSFNSSVIDVINYYKIPKSKLPKNSYQKYIQYKIDLPGNLEPYRVKIRFSEPVFSQTSDSRNLVINDRAKVQSVELRMNARNMDDEQFANIVDELVSKLEGAGYELDTDASQSAWKTNSSTYRLDRTIIEINSGSSGISIKVDFSEYF
jgi:hypothetical protein